jgi:hypothetical protein
MACFLHRSARGGEAIRSLGTRVALLFLWLSWVPASVAFAQSDTPGEAQTVAAALDRSTRANLRGVLADSLKLLMIEHMTRIAIQAKTRRELGGQFLGDYRRSVRLPRQWEDTDSFTMNYVGHPIHGAAAAFIFIEHSPTSRQQPFGLNADYLHSRWRPVLASALYSIQFEIGPLSEASIGNVGQRPETTGWVDYVVTPLGALAFLFGEDALNLLMEKIETRIQNRFARMILRMTFGPSRAMSNFAMGRAPWHRDSRPLGWR